MSDVYLMINVPDLTLGEPILGIPGNGFMVNLIVQDLYRIGGHTGKKVDEAFVVYICEESRAEAIKAILKKKRIRVEIRKKKPEIFRLT